MRKYIFISYSDGRDHGFIFADNVEQDQTAHTCNLILHCTLRCSAFEFFSGNPIECQLTEICIIVKKLSLAEQVVVTLYRDLFIRLMQICDQKKMFICIVSIL